MAGMFDDLVPGAAAATPFDDLVPAARKPSGVGDYLHNIPARLAQLGGKATELAIAGGEALGFDYAEPTAADIATMDAAINQPGMSPGDLLTAFTGNQKAFARALQTPAESRPVITTDSLDTIKGDLGSVFSRVPSTAPATALLPGGLPIALTQAMTGFVGSEDPFADLERAGRMARFSGQTIAASAPDMAAATIPATLPAYMLARTEEVADERAANDGRGDASWTDRGVAAPAAAIESLLERFTTARLLPGGTPAGGSGALARVLQEGGIQAGGEVVEELAPYLAATAGTETGATAQGAGDAALAAILAGGPMGGGAQGIKELAAALGSGTSPAAVPPVPAPPPAAAPRPLPPMAVPLPPASTAAPDADLDALLLRNVLPPESTPVPVTPPTAPAAAPVDTAPPALPQRAQRPAEPPPAATPDGRRAWRPSGRKDSKGRAIVEPVVDLSRDTLIEWLGSVGGVDFEQVRSQAGADPDLLRDPAVMRPFGHVGWSALRKRGGMDLETLREKMQEAGWLQQDDPNAPPTTGVNDALDLVMEAINGRPVLHPTAGVDERAQRQRETMREQEEAADADLALDLGFPDAGAMYAELERADDAGEGFSEADYTDALSLQDLATRAYDAGATSVEIVDAMNLPSEAEQAAALWEMANRESSRGTDAGSADERGQGRGAPRRGEEPSGRVEAPRTGYATGSLLPEPTAREEVAAEQRRRDAARDGLGRDVVPPSEGDGDLFAGDRPDQLRIGERESRYVTRGRTEYLADERGQPRDFLTEGAAQDAARAVGGRVLIDAAIEGQRPTWSVIRPPVGSIDENRADYRDDTDDGDPTKVRASRDMFTRTRGDRAPAEPGNGQDQDRNRRQDGDSGPASAGGVDAGAVRPRADASPVLTRRSLNAVDELVRRNRGSVLADTLARDFRYTETAQLIGQRVRSHQDLAALASVYRNPIFETLHYVFVDESGRVLGETAVSDRMATTSAAFPSGFASVRAIAKWIEDMAPPGATGMWMMHNHPSGNPSPSGADLRVTKAVDDLLNSHASRIRLRGHVILNHKTFGRLTPEGEDLGVADLPDVKGPDPLRANRGVDVSAMLITSPAAAAQVGKEIHALTDYNSVAVIVANARGDVALATAFPSESLLAKRGPAILSQLGDRTGGLRVFLVANRELVGGPGGATYVELQALSKRGIVTDVIVIEEDGRAQALAELGHMAAKSLGDQSAARRRRDGRGDRVFEDAPAYTNAQSTALTKAGLQPDARNVLQRSADRLRDEWAKVRAALSDTDALKQAAFDRFHGLRAAEARMGGLAPEESPYLAARLSTGLASIMESLNLFGAPQWRDGVLSIDPDTKGLLDVLEPVKDDMDAWLGWMVGRRARLLKSQGRENLFTDADIDALLSLANGKEQAFRAAATGYLKIKNAVLDVAEQAGLIDPAQRAAWDHAEYLPFYRQEGDRALGPGTRRGLAGQNSGIRTLKGGESALADPMANILRNFTKLIDASLKNRAMLLAVDKLDTALFEKQGPEFSTALIPMDQVRKQLLADGVPQSVIDGMPAGALKGVQKMFSLVPPTGDDVVRIMRDGKAEHYKVTDPLLLRALTAFKEPTKTWAIKPFIFAKRLLTTGVTATAEFVGANLARDTASTWIIGNDRVRLGIDAANGAFRTLMRDKATRDMMAAGGSFIGGNFYGGDQDATAAALRRTLRARGLKDRDIEGFVGTVARSPLMLWDKWMSLSSAIENANRHAVFTAAMREGKSRAQAIFEAKDLMDFSMQGDSAFMQFFSDVLPFFNARVQGLYKLGRATADPKSRKRIATRGALLALASTALWYWNVTMYGDAYDELEEWDKDTYWHIAPGTEWHTRIPKPFEIGLLFGTGPERMAQTIVGNDRGEQSWSALLRAITGTLAINPIPQGALPIVEQWANRRFFTGRPIENMGDDKLLPEAREEWYSSDTMKLIADGVGNQTGLSAKRLEHLWNGYTGGLGGYVLDASDWLVREAGGAPERPEMAMSEVPVLGRFLRGDDPKSSRYVTEFYDLREQASQVSGTIKEYLEDGQVARAERLEREHAWLLGKRIPSKRAKAGIMFENVREMEKLVRTLGEQRRDGEEVAAGDASGAEKREQLNTVTADRNAAVKKLVRRLREAERQRP